MARPKYPSFYIFVTKTFVWLKEEFLSSNAERRPRTFVELPSCLSNKGASYPRSTVYQHGMRNTADRVDDLLTGVARSLSLVCCVSAVSTLTLRQFCRLSIRYSSRSGLLYRVNRYSTKINKSTRWTSEVFPSYSPQVRVTAVTKTFISWSAGMIL